MNEKGNVRLVRRSVAATLIATMASSITVFAAEPVDEVYVRSLAAPGRTVLVIEYYDGRGAISSRKGYTSSSGYQPTSATDFRVSDNLSLHLYGIEPCDGDMVNRQEDFAGSCAEFAQRGLATLLQSPRVVFCRAFVTEQNASVQNATCYGYYSFPGSLDSVDMFEEQLVSLGTHRIAKKADGTPARADLVEAEQIGRNGYGMWADQRISEQ